MGFRFYGLRVGPIVHRPVIIFVDPVSGDCELVLNKEYLTWDFGQDICT